MFLIVVPNTFIVSRIPFAAIGRNIEPNIWICMKYQGLKAPWYFIHIQILGSMFLPIAAKGMRETINVFGSRKTWPPPGLSSAYPDSRAEYIYRFPHSFRRNRKELARFSDLVVGTWKKLDMATGLDLS
jgi:hypothetical protein